MLPTCTHAIATHSGMQEAQTAARMEVESLADRSVVDVVVLPHYSGQGLCLVPKDLAPLLLEHREQLL